MWKLLRNFRSERAISTFLSSRKREEGGSKLKVGLSLGYPPSRKSKRK